MPIFKFGNRLARDLRQYAFLRTSLHTIFLCPFVCIFLGGLVWGITLGKLNHEYAAQHRNALKEASSLSNAYAEQLSRSLEQLDQITLTVKYYWHETEGRLRLENQHRQGLYPLSAQLYVLIFDRDGNRISGTAPRPARVINVADRDYFIAHKSGRATGLLILPPYKAREVNQTLIGFSRALTAPDGAFDGIVLVCVEPAYLAAFYDQSSLRKSDFLAVADTDGMLFASKESQAGRATSGIFKTPPIFHSDREVALLPDRHFVDNQARIVAWQALHGYPLVSIVGVSEKDFFAAYEAIASDYRNFAVAASFFLLLAALIGAVTSARFALKSRQAQEIRDTYRLATESGSDGFYRVRALYDGSGQIIDFKFEDCNVHGAAVINNMTRNQLIGLQVSSLMSAEKWQEALPMLLQAMKDGVYEDEYESAPDSPLTCSFIHRKFVRVGSGLAITLRDITAAKTHENNLVSIANEDELTKLPNRYWLMSYLPKALEQAREERQSLALLFVDLDDFKNINDTLGHAAGDELLQAVASRLKSVVRPHDKVVRLGGDEFTVILGQVGNADSARGITNRIIKEFDELIVLSGGSSHAVHASIGISMFPQDGDTAEVLLKHADIAMYAAKTNGKSHYKFYEPQLSTCLQVRLDNEAALNQAVACDEFFLLYQPRVDTVTGQLVGMEALVRWMHPQRGMVPPLEFIALAERTGLIVRLGEMVIEKACAQLAAWNAQDLPLVPVSVNVSPRQFSVGNINTLFETNIARHGIDPSMLEIEITESSMLGESETISGEFAALQALGLKLLVDDFGTGYSSLSQLQRLDLDVLKIDRAFTAELGKSREGEVFFKAIVSMAQALDMRVVAEGVETAEQLRLLQKLCCDEVQGYFISRPVPAGDIPELMRKRFLFPLQEPDDACVLV